MSAHFGARLSPVKRTIFRPVVILLSMLAVGVSAVGISYQYLQQHAPNTNPKVGWVQTFDATLGRYVVGQCDGTSFYYTSGGEFNIIEHYYQCN